MRSSLLILLALPVLTGCETTDSDDWTGGELTPFVTADRTCEEQAANIRGEEERIEFYVGCMEALGWQPEPGAEPDI